MLLFTNPGGHGVSGSAEADGELLAATDAATAVCVPVGEVAAVADRDGVRGGAAHTASAVELQAATKPAGHVEHAWHADAPTACAYLPAAQAVHTREVSAPDTLLYQPAGQDMQPLLYSGLIIRSRWLLRSGTISSSVDRRTAKNIGSLKRASGDVPSA